MSAESCERPWFVKVAKGVKEWKNELEKSANIPRHQERDLFSAFDEFYIDEVPNIPNLNIYCKHAYNPCISSFKGALSQLYCRMKSEDFFPDIIDKKEKMMEHSTDLDSLRKSITWDHSASTKHYRKYVDKASELHVLAQEIRKGLLEHMEGNPAWESLVDQKEKILANRSDDERFMELISKNRREINALMLDHFTKNDKERWEALIRAVGPVLKYEPLTNNGDIYSFDGFDDLVAYFTEYVKERCITNFWGNFEILFEKDLAFSRSLNKKMDLMLSKNALNREGIRIPEAGENDSDLYS